MEKKKIIGYTTGVYDMFHVGHLNLIKNAKKHCDYLIVGVTSDKLSINEKKVIPVINQHDRAEIVKSIKYVDEVVFQDNYDKFKAYKKYNFNKMFVGNDWKNTKKWNDHERKFKKYNVEIVYFQYTKHVSSSILKEKLSK